MKIDIHTHTLKCKQGDPDTREISPDDFCDILSSTQVQIVAITNHNHFDLAQYTSIISKLPNGLQVWPGVELDVFHDGRRGHLLLIVSPKLASSLHATLSLLTANTTPDEFNIEINDVIATFESLKPLYIAHYDKKTPNLSDEAIKTIVNSTSHPERVLKEVTNSISAGIFISHGHPSIYGSDVQDWTDYEKISATLPDLRLPVDSFDHFCLLLQKDPTTINTALNSKQAETLTLFPFNNSEPLSLKVYNDINIIFGSKGTGKSCILESIANHYMQSGKEANVFETSKDRLDEEYFSKADSTEINLDHYDINYCTDEILALKGAEETDITSIEHYVRFYSTNATNKNAIRMKLKDCDPEQTSEHNRLFADLNNSFTTSKTFIEFLQTDNACRLALEEDDFSELLRLVSLLADRLDSNRFDSFTTWRGTVLFNSLIEKLRLEVQRKTGNPVLPTTTGFRDYALNRINIELAAREVLRNVHTKLPSKIESVGSLGPDKGNLHFHTEMQFQTGSISNADFKPFKKVRKTTQKKFIKAIQEIADSSCNDYLFEKIAALLSIEELDSISTVYELLMINQYFAIDGTSYQPSSGEASMVMLEKELNSHKDIYILDEPERSLGNEYISDVIVPLIKEKAKSGKKIFISTHDANIAVRTLPYCSIYRYHGPSGYMTYCGNPFSNNVTNIADVNDCLDWKETSMKTLEGGEQAFGERRTIYGHY